MDGLYAQRLPKDPVHANLLPLEFFILFPPEPSVVFSMLTYDLTANAARTVACLTRNAWKWQAVWMLQCNLQALQSCSLGLLCCNAQNGDCLQAAGDVPKHN